jgi:4-hydroxy-tetrahydrodipicolinate synthase
MQLKGALTAIVTPFANGEVDEESYRALIEWQIESGIHGLVPCGTTGESATLSHEEHKRVVAICVDQVKKRVPVLAGAGSNNTREAVELTRYAKQAGADAALHITPYYNKPTPAGLIEHFAAVAREVPMPIIVYNVPGRTSLNVLPATLAKIRQRVPEVVGVKEATGNLAQVSEVLEYCGRDFILLSGDDFTVLPTLAVGGAGVISVTSNIVPGKMSALVDAYFAGDMKKAQDIHYEISALNRGMFLETNPIPVKTALAAMGKIKKEFRLPLTPMAPENETKIMGIMKDARLI